MSDAGGREGTRPPDEARAAPQSEPVEVEATAEAERLEPETDKPEAAGPNHVGPGRHRPDRDEPEVIDVEPLPERRGFGRKLLVIALTLLFLAIAGAGATYTVWRPLVDDYAKGLGIVLPVSLASLIRPEPKQVPAAPDTAARAEPDRATPANAGSAAPPAPAQSNPAGVSASNAQGTPVAPTPDPMPAAANAEPDAGTAAAIRAQAERIEEIEQQIAGLQARIEAMERDAPRADATAALDRRVAGLDRRLAAVESRRVDPAAPGPSTSDTRPPPAGAPDLTPIEARLAALEAMATSAPAATPGEARDLKPIEARLAALEDQAKAAPAAAPADTAGVLPALLALSERLARLEVREVPTRKDVDAVAGTAAEVGRKLDAVAEAGTQADKRLAATADAVAEADRKIAATAEAAAETDRKLAGVAEAVEQIRQSLASAMPSRDRASLLLLAVSQLAAAAEGSAPFAAQLDAMRALAEGDATLSAPVAALAAPAASGARTLAGLRAAFPDAMAATLRAQAVGADTDTVGRTLSAIASLATVRRLTGQAENSVDSVLTAAENELRAGNLAGAVATLERLDGAPATAIRPWLDDARARLATDAAVAALRAAVLATVAKTAG